jgi:phosphoglycerate dehydrogenase-like enzyme
VYLFYSKLITCKRSNLDDKYPYIDKVYGYNDIEKFFNDSDIVISTLPLTDSTKDLIDIKLLKLLGKNGLFINIGRGATVVEKDLYNALVNYDIAGAALDVFWNEKDPNKADNKIYPYTLPFHELDNVILSPHRAASPMSDLKRWDPVIDNIIRLNENKPLINLINIKEGY